MTQLAIDDPKFPNFMQPPEQVVTFGDLQSLVESLQNLEKVRNQNWAAENRERIIVDKVEMGRGTSGGGVISWKNPTGVKIFVYGLIVDITVGEATATSPTLSVGVDNTPTGLSNSLIDQLPATSTGPFTSFDDAGTAGKAVRAVAKDFYVVGNLTVVSGIPAEFAGNIYIPYIIA